MGDLMDTNIANILNKVVSPSNNNTNYYEIYSQAYSKLLQKYRPSLPFLNVKNIMIDDWLKGKNITLLDCIAYGPNSLIFIGKHKSTEKFVTIKVLLKNVIEDLGGLVIKRNLPYDKLYVSDRISRVYEFMSNSENLRFILSDYFAKGSLARILIDNNGPLQENAAQLIFKGVLKGLNHMHSIKIAHRNLKLENIFLDDDFTPVISDYTHTIVIENGDNFESLISTTLPYLAPEIISRIPYDPIIADVWSFGVCLFVVLNDSLPFCPNEKLKKLYSNYKFKPELEHTLSIDVKNCLRNLLQFDVNKRATTAKLMKDAWFQK